MFIITVSLFLLIIVKHETRSPKPHQRQDNAGLGWELFFENIPKSISTNILLSHFAHFSQINTPSFGLLLRLTMAFRIEVAGEAAPLTPQQVYLALQSAGSSQQQSIQTGTQQLQTWETQRGYYTLLQVTKLPGQNLCLSFELTQTGCIS